MAKKPVKKHSVVAIRHVGFEDLGSFAGTLRKRGFGIAYREAAFHDLGAIDPLAPDLLVVLGGPIGAYEESLYPFLIDELKILEKRIAANRPTLGICLGAQLMARALGARVYPNSAKEMDWSALTLTEDGMRSPLRHVAPDKTRVLNWHGDTFDLPEGATRLASTDITKNQAFAFGKRALALQFHVEVTAQSIEHWLIGHACEIAGTKGAEVPELRAATAAHTPALEIQGPKCFEAWLDLAGLGRSPLDGTGPRAPLRRPIKKKKNTPKKNSPKKNKSGKSKAKPR